MSQSLDDLIKLGIKRGYKNPTYWAKSIINARRSKNGTKKLLIIGARPQRGVCMELGKLVKIELIKRDMKQIDLAKLLGVSFANLNGVINNRHASIKLEIKLLEWVYNK